MGIVWTPSNTLPAEFIDSVISTNVSAVYTPIGTEVVASVTAEWDVGSTVMSPWVTLTPSNTTTTASVNVAGTPLIDMFDQYSVTYVDKGESDNTQTPVVTTIDLVPDSKDIYAIHVDPRLVINVSFTVTVFIEDNNIPVTSYSNVYDFDITQTYTNIKSWTDTYFSTRY